LPSAAEDDLAVVGVDGDGAAVDPAGDDQIAADINQARLPWARAGEGIAVEELGAGGDGPVVGHGFAGFGDGDGLPALETGGADLDGDEVGVGRKKMATNDPLSLVILHGAPKVFYTVWIRSEERGFHL